MIVPATVYISDKIKTDNNALSQLTDATKIPGVVKVLATPDIHLGYGVPIGCVMATDNVVSPSAVGYDINCGMRLITTPLYEKDIDAQQLAHSISRDIPLGEGKTNVKVTKPVFKKVMSFGLDAYKKIAEKDRRLSDFFNENELADDINKTEDFGKMPGNPDAVSKRAVERGIAQLGTLGGGNHFIEIQKVTDIYDEKKARAFGIEKDMITVMVHSGSRGFGHEIAGEYMKIALNECKNKAMPIPSKQLTYLYADTQKGKDFTGAMHAAANFAYVNRLIMIMLIRKNIRYEYGKNLALPSLYGVPHNMVKKEKHGDNYLWIHRKGATRAFPPELMQPPFDKTGQPVIIPGSMGTHSYILAGVSTGSESLYSVCHGAGRVMSRTEAAGKRKKGRVVKEAKITDGQFEESIKGVHLICEKRVKIKEEAPGAYKDIDEVIDVIAGAGLAQKVARVKPLAVLKG